ncbi:MAG: hypothetical protein ACJAU0_000986 [Flavobacteriales bacterium]|jgi:hypothetical protein
MEFELKRSKPNLNINTQIQLLVAEWFFSSGMGFPRGVWFNQRKGILRLTLTKKNNRH